MSAGTRADGPVEPLTTPLRTRVRQVAVLLIGAGVAAVMVVLGWWQLGVYTATGERAAADRADAPPVPVSEVAPPGASAATAFGRTVSAQGRYDPALQVLVPVPDQGDRFRVVTALRMVDGGVLTVVRGVSAAPAPDPPEGVVTVTGILLPSEDGEDPGTSVRLPLLAQTWPGPLVSGLVTLPPALAQEQGLAPATVDLPAAPGRMRNGAYALQWWLFAGFALLFASRVARDIGQSAEQSVPADDEASAVRST